MPQVPLPDPDRLEEREPGPVRQLIRLFLGQMLAVGAITAVIVLVVSLVGPDRDDDLRATNPSTSSTAAATPSSPAPSAPSATGAPSSTAPAPTTPAPVAQPRVDVLNQSAGRGDAATTAQRLRADGWRIGRVDDFRGNVAATTVYYPTRDLRAAARRVADDLPGSPRVRAGFSTLSSKRLSVILVD